ncbi:MAG TPA: metal ABC transporter ATP-binding protein [Solirubrobacteraceae bacterium]|jgi:manganese/iron transport system ATP-binding protein/manganese/zinc/iron transport system ATP- binding protein
MLVRAEHLQAGYAPGQPVVRGVEFAVAAGQAVAVLAPNGGGKTTLFRTLLGELPPLGGTFAVDGTIAAVHQHDHARLDFPVSALDVALMGAYGRTPWWRRIAGADRAAARAALDRVGLVDREGTHFGSLSGGQRRRVMIARAIVQDARILLLDEPFAGVDRASEERILTVLEDLAAEGRTLLIATHDVEQSRRWDRVLCLNGRQIAFGTPEETLTAPTLAATYGPELVVLREGRMGLTIQHHEH